MVNNLEKAYREVAFEITGGALPDKLSYGKHIHIRFKGHEGKSINELKELIHQELSAENGVGKTLKTRMNLERNSQITTEKLLQNKESLEKECTKIKNVIEKHSKLENSLYYSVVAGVGLLAAGIAYSAYKNNHSKSWKERTKQESTPIGMGI